MRIYLGYNCAPPTDSSYGWMPIPTTLQAPGPIIIEERAGIYRGPYSGSVGALKYSGLCTIGSFSYSYSRLPKGLVIGRYCSISDGLNFLDSHHPTTTLTTSAMTFRPHNKLWADIISENGRKSDRSWSIHNHKKFPIIGNDVWIAKNVTLSMGITVGDGAIIAANSVVTKDVPPYAIVGGNPAQIIKYRAPDEVRDRLQATAWWNLCPSYITSVMTLPIEKCVDEIERSQVEIERFCPRTIILG